MAVHIKSLQSIRPVEGAGSDRKICTAVHIEPPKKVGTSEIWAIFADGFPNFFTAH